jgi:hypothetical protein
MRDHYRGGTNAVTNHSTGTVEPEYQGTVAAIAAAHAGLEVSIQRLGYRADGTPVIRVRLPHEGSTGRPAGVPHAGFHEGPYYPTPNVPARRQPQQAPVMRRFVEERPHVDAPEYRHQHRPPMFTHGQKTFIVGGAVTAMVLVAFALVLKIFMAAIAFVAMYGAVILGFVVMGLTVWIIAGRVGGAGGGAGGAGGPTNIVTSITAKTIGKIFIGGR